MIHFDHVSYSYPGAAQPALHDLSLTIPEGDFVLVIGGSGSGKSTFLRAINGLVPHFYGGRFDGSVTVAGRDTRAHEPRQLSDVVGFVFQDPEAQMVVEIVEDELVFAMENHGVAPAVMRRRVEEVLDQLEIADLRRRRVTTLSGGERQRVAIASVLALQPRVLVLDEPTSQLDPHTAEEVLTALQKLNADLGLTIVLSEHRLERVVQYADHILLFDRPDARPPRVVLGSPREVLRDSPFAPPLVELGRALGWQPVPLTIKEARRHVVAHGLDRAMQPQVEQASMPERRAWFRRSSPAASPALATPALQVEGLSVERGGSTILYDVALTLGAGEILALMGRNGSGKTTLLRAVMGLFIPNRGRIALAGDDLVNVPVEQRATRIGYVPQDPRALLFHETVEAELRWTLRQGSRRLNEAETDARVRRTLARLKLDALSKAHPRELSGGEQQRVALAAILIAETPLLLLDEPTRGLDYHTKAALIDLLLSLRAAGRSILLVTHDVELVAACADRIVLLGNGEVVVTGTPRELMNDSLIFSSQIGKLFRQRPWLTVAEAQAALLPRD